MIKPFSIKRIADFDGIWRSVYPVKEGSYPSDYGYGFLYLLIERISFPSLFLHRTKFKVYSRFNEEPDPNSSDGYAFVEIIKTTNTRNTFRGFAQNAFWSDAPDGREEFVYTLVGHQGDFMYTHLFRENDHLPLEFFRRIK